MFDLGWSEMMVVGVLALIIVGPKDLPKLFKQLSYWIKQLRGMASEFQSGVNEMVREADLEDAKKMFDTAQEFNPKNQFKNLIDPDKTLEKDLDIESDLGEGNFDDFEIDESLLFKDPATSENKSEPIKATPKKPTAKKTTVKKKAVAKKAPAKKPVTKKAAPKKTAATKTAPKKAKTSKKPKATKTDT